MTFSCHDLCGKVFRAGANTSNALRERYSAAALILQFPEQPGELTKVTQFAVLSKGAFFAGRWENEDQRTIQALLLQPQFAGPLRKILIGGLAVEGDDLRRVLLQFLRQHNAAFGEFLAAEFLRPAGRPLDQVSQPDSEFNHAFVIAMIQKFRHDPGIVKQRPEFVSTPGVIMSYASRAVPG